MLFRLALSVPELASFTSRVADLLSILVFFFFDFRGVAPERLPPSSGGEGASHLREFLFASPAKSPPLVWFSCTPNL